MIIPPGIASLSDWERHARAALDDNAWTYLTSPAADGVTVAGNRGAFDAIHLLPRLLRDCRGGSTATTLLGADITFPILLAPVAYQRLFHPEGEAASAMAAAALNTIMVASTLSSITLEAIAEASADGARWFQLYVQPDRGFTAELVARAREAGYSAVVVTADAPVVGTRNADQRIGFRLPDGISAANLAGMPMPEAAAGEDRVFDAALRGQATWTDFERLAATAGLPVLLKGVLHPDDARRAIGTGAAGIIVSNHGGRVLDGAVPAIRALPAIAEAVAGRAPILLDSGVRRGTDVLKALALGASAVMIGRPAMMALAGGGALGVAHALKLLAEELAVAMALCGFRSVAEIDASVIAK